MTQNLNHMDLAQLMADARVSSNSLESIAQSLHDIAEAYVPKKGVPSATERGMETKNHGTAVHDITVHVAIGNSDNKLTQEQWANYVNAMRQVIHGWNSIETVYGEWYSASDSKYQNACWGIKCPNDREALREALAVVCRNFKQHDIAWTEGITEMITPFGLPD